MWQVSSHVPASDFMGYSASYSLMRLSIGGNERVHILFIMGLLNAMVSIVHVSSLIAAPGFWVHMTADIDVRCLRPLTHVESDRVRWIS
ncbi:hypothetical protein L210DRAFT_944475 [Boletus edulis BED1]|uniref:Uncharacterized protein n=1 Tax=Boletus edulis BED1 TaxID=1328754 RepID=A0AAD4BNH8_BOLED|nr:hypothetical protein L210DRAFT_944475 [Boletus edulis BED1]